MPEREETPNLTLAESAERLLREVGSREARLRQCSAEIVGLAILPAAGSSAGWARSKAGPPLERRPHQFCRIPTAGKTQWDWARILRRRNAKPGDLVRKPVRRERMPKHEETPNLKLAESAERLIREVGSREARLRQCSAEMGRAILPAAAFSAGRARSKAGPPLERRPHPFCRTPTAGKTQWDWARILRRRNAKPADLVRTPVRREQHG